MKTAKLFYLENFPICRSWINIYEFTGGIDYFPGPFLVTFPAGVTNASFPILIADDETPEITEYFEIYIVRDSLQYRIRTYPLSQSFITIQDNDCKLIVYVRSLIKLIILYILVELLCSYRMCVWYTDIKINFTLQEQHIFVQNVNLKPSVAACLVSVTCFCLLRYHKVR